MRKSDLERKVRRVERCLGIDVQIILNDNGSGWLGSEDNGEWLITKLGTPSKWEEGIRSHHESIYHRRGQRKYAEQQGKCSKCGVDLRGVCDINHIRHRGAHGRDDRMDNLEAVCNAFTSGGCDWHQREHGNAKNYKIRLDSESTGG